MTRKTLNRKERNILRNTSFFIVLSDEEFASLISDDRCFTVEFAKNSDISADERYHHCLAYINKGEAIVKSQSSVFLLRHIGSGNFFGVINLFSEEERYVSDITAGKDTEIVFFEKSLIRECIQTNSAFALSFISFLTDRICFLNRKIDLISNGSNTSKLLNYLINESYRSNEVKVERSYAKLAESLNMGRSSLYRAIEELEKEDLIIRKDKTILIKDIERIKKRGL